MSTPLPGVPWTSGGVDDMTAEIDARNDAAEDAAESDTEIAAHLGDSADAHPASAISVLDTAGVLTAVQVEAALKELYDLILAEVAALPSIVQAANGDVTWDNVTDPDELAPIIGERLSRVIATPTPASAVTGTASATSLLSATFTPPANQIAAQDVLEFIMWGTTIQNVDADETLTLRLRYNNANLFPGGAMTITGPSATARVWTMRVLVKVTGASGGTLSGVGGNIQMGTTSPTGNALDIDRLVAGSNQTIDLTNPAAFDLTAQHSSSSASQSTVLVGMVARHHRTP